MLQREVGRALAAPWKQSSAKYGGRTWPLVAVMLSNLTAVVFFGGGLMLCAVAGLEAVYSQASPDAATWFTHEAGVALRGYGITAFLGSVVPMAITVVINRRYRNRCKTCGR